MNEELFEEVGFYVVVPDMENNPEIEFFSEMTGLSCEEIRELFEVKRVVLARYNSNGEEMPL